VLDARSSGSDASSGLGSGGGVIFVELLGEGDAVAPPPRTAAAAIPSARTSRTTPPAPPRAPAPAAPIAGPAAARAESIARAPESATQPLQPAEPAAQPVAPEARVAQASPASPAADTAADAATGRGPGSGARGSAAGNAHAPGAGAPDGRLARVARPASEIRPRYPEAARERGDEGEVIVETWVAASGRVARARVRSSAGRDLDAAALEAVHRARFHPAWRDGEPVASVVAMRLHFELER